MSTFPFFLRSISLNEMRALFLYEPHFKISIYYKKSAKDIYNNNFSTLPSWSMSNELNILCEKPLTDCNPIMPIFLWKCNWSISSCMPAIFLNLNKNETILFSQLLCLLAIEFDWKTSHPILRRFPNFFSPITTTHK